jgi:hypothetical protein
VRLGDAPAFIREAAPQGSVEVRFLTSPPHTFGHPEIGGVPDPPGCALNGP